MEGPPVYRDHLYRRTTCIEEPPVWKDHLFIETTCIEGPPVEKDPLSMETIVGWPRNQCSNAYCCTSTLGTPVYRPQLLGPTSGLYRQVSLYAVKPVYNHHSRDQVMVVSVDRWSLYRGALVSLRWPMEQPTVVSIDRWSLYRGALVSLRWPVEQPTVVSIDRWSLYRGALVSLRWPVEQPTVVSIDRWSCLYKWSLKDSFTVCMCAAVIYAQV